MPTKIFGNPELLHNNDAKPSENKGALNYPAQNTEAIDKIIHESSNFEALIQKYSAEDPKTWNKCLIAGAKLTLYFEFRNTNPNPNQNKKFRGKLSPGANDSIDKLLALAQNYKLTLDSTITVNRAAIAYYESKKKIFPKSQPHVITQISFYPDK